MIEPDTAAFPRAPLNPSAAPWSRAVEKRIQAAEKKAATLGQKLDQANRIIAAIKERGFDGAMNFQGEFEGGTDSGGYVIYSGKQTFNFTDLTLPQGWRSSDVMTQQPSHWPSGFVYGYPHPLDGLGITLTARPGFPAWVEFDIPPDQEGAVRWWYTYDAAFTGEDEPDENGDLEYGPDPANPNGPQIMLKGVHVGPIEILTSRTAARGGDADGMFSWGNGYGSFNVADYGVTGTAPDRLYENTPTYRIEIRSAGPGPRSIYIDALMLAAASSWQQAELIRDGTSPEDPIKTVVVPPTNVGGKTYHAGDTVSVGGTLWTALTDTDGSAPVEGEMWTSLAGSDEAAYEYAGEWTP